MFGFSKVSSKQEREFERRNVEKKRESYLRSNPADRFDKDPIYREKIQNAERTLKELFGDRDQGMILDLGGNTGGEATVLAQMGFDFVLADINETALEVAVSRAEKFGLKVPKCVAADVHALPFQDQTFGAVMVVEALHHFEDYDVALKEILRVLKPGGFLLSFEPIGWNPIRRLSEIRDRFRGTIEKSFTSGQLHRLLRAAGFEEIRVEAVSSGRSDLQMDSVPPYRRFLARFHARLQQRHPRFFGNYRIVGFRSSESDLRTASRWPDCLRSPETGEPLRREGGFWIGADEKYPDLNGIPVLIREDRMVDEK